MCRIFTAHPTDPTRYTDSWGESLCPEDCAPCAQCFAAEEADLSALIDDPCECETVEIGIDPCFASDSCGCICSPYDSLMEDCGPQATGNCAVECPDGYWPETDGSLSCACAANIGFEIQGNPVEPSFVAMSTETSLFIGGINRFDFNFTWSYDDPNMADEEMQLMCTVGYLINDADPYPPESNTTFFLPENADDRHLNVTCTYDTPGGLEGSSVGRLMLPDEGFFSIRTVGTQFEGHVWLVVSSTDGFTLQVSGPFNGPAPEYK
jgi:hypothetical protein